MFDIFNKTQKEPEDLKGVLERLKKIEESQGNISRDLRAFMEKSKKDLQKVGMVRFNPFSEAGGDQSFCIAVLNADNDGFVITSHFLRETSRVYAKPIIKAQSQYQLSEEEKNAISKAINS